MTINLIGHIFRTESKWVLNITKNLTFFLLHEKVNNLRSPSDFIVYHAEKTKQIKITTWNFPKKITNTNPIKNITFNLCKHKPLKVYNNFNQINLNPLKKKKKKLTSYLEFMFFCLTSLPPCRLTRKLQSKIREI